MYQHAAKIAINTDDCVDDDDYVDDTTNVRLSDRVSNPIFLEEARRYMRYATAGTYLYLHLYLYRIYRANDLRHPLHFISSHLI